MPDSSVPITAGTGTSIDTITTPAGDHRQVVYTTKERGGFRGSVSTWRTPGRAGTSGQRLMAIHNASGSSSHVEVHAVYVDLYQTVIKAITVAPPVIRLRRFTAVPTNGSSLTKVPTDTAISSSGSVTAWGDASADGTLAGSALNITIPAGGIITQELAPRYITAAGYEMADRIGFLEQASVLLRPLEGIVLELAYTATTQNPATDMWIATAFFEEFTP